MKVAIQKTVFMKYLKQGHLPKPKPELDTYM